MRISPHARRLGTVLAGLAIVTTLASCGGDGDGGGNNDNTPPVTPPPAASNTPPASASASSLGFIAYLKVLTPTNPENVGPLDLTNFVAPVDDSGAFDPSI